MNIRNIRLVALLLFVAAAALGIVALATPPVEAGGPKCIIKCVEGVCERCCHERGGWVCT